MRVLGTDESQVRVLKVSHLAGNLTPPEPKKTGNHGVRTSQSHSMKYLCDVEAFTTGRA